MAGVACRAKTVTSYNTPNIRRAITRRMFVVHFSTHEYKTIDWPTCIAQPKPSYRSEKSRWIDTSHNVHKNQIPVKTLNGEAESCKHIDPPKRSRGHSITLRYRAFCLYIQTKGPLFTDLID